MAKVQTRKSISINGQLFAKLRQHCQAHGVSMSAYISRLIEGDLSSKYTTTTGRLSSAKPPLTRPRETGNPGGGTATPKSTPPTRNSRSDPFTF